MVSEVTRYRQVSLYPWSSKALYYRSILAFNSLIDYSLHKVIATISVCRYGGSVDSRGYGNIICRPTTTRIGMYSTQIYTTLILDIRMSLFRNRGPDLKRFN